MGTTNIGYINTDARVNSVITGFFTWNTMNKRGRLNTCLENIDTVDLLHSSDISEVLSLSSRTEWNQTESDWLRLMDLNPDSCFVYRKSDRIVGTSTLAAFGSEMAWIGMVIVDPEFRGQGIGKCILETTIQKARDTGYSIIGLDATDQGRPLYHKYGFQDVQPIDRWSGSLKGSGTTGAVHPMDENHLQEAIKFDSQWSQCDRSHLLRHLFFEKSNQSLYLTRNHRPTGFIFMRPGLKFNHIGPVLSESIEDFAILMEAAAFEMQGKPVLVDAIRREDTTTLLKHFGLNVQRQLTRMTLDSSIPILCNTNLRVAVSFEWG